MRFLCLVYHEEIETKEHLGGFIVIEASDLDEATRLAAKIPPLRLGSIEIRPIQELEPRRDQSGPHVP